MISNNVSSKSHIPSIFKPNYKITLMSESEKLKVNDQKYTKLDNFNKLFLNNFHQNVKKDAKINNLYFYKYNNKCQNSLNHKTETDSDIYKSKKNILILDLSQSAKNIRHRKYNSVEINDKKMGTIIY